MRTRARQGAALHPRVRHPAAAAARVALVGYAVLVAVMLAIGLVVAEALAGGSFGDWETSVNEWFVQNRTSTWDTLTDVGSKLADTFTVIGIAVVIVAVLVRRHRWKEATALAVALLVEVSVFLTVAYVLDRPRPDVPRLDHTPPTSSYPSGHMAASIALYGTLFLLCSQRVRNTAVRAAVGVIGVGAPVAVGLSRVYRGLHHPTDVLASVLLGLACIAVAFVAVRAAERARRQRQQAVS
jgi:undecaprenyl-diphosphatase